MKAKKIITISLPIVLATTAVAGASVALVSCSKKEEITNVIVTNTVADTFADALKVQAQTITKANFVAAFDNKQDDTAAYTELASKLSDATNIVTANDIASVTATDTSVTITPVSGKTFTFSGTTNPDITITKGAIVVLGLTFKAEVTDVVIKDSSLSSLKTKFEAPILASQEGFDWYFTNESTKPEAINNVVSAFGVDSGITPEMIDTVDAAGTTVTESTITISPKTGYKFVSEQNNQLRTIGATITENGEIKITGVTLKDGIDFTATSNKVAKAVATAIKTAVTNVNGTVNLANAQKLLDTNKTQIASAISSTANATVTSITPTVNSVTIVINQSILDITTTPIDVNESGMTVASTLSVIAPNTIVITGQNLFKEVPILDFSTSGVDTTFKTFNSSTFVSSSNYSTDSAVETMNTSNNLAINGKASGENYYQIKLPTNGSLSSVFTEGSSGVTLSQINAISWEVIGDNANSRVWKIGDCGSNGNCLYNTDNNAILTETTVTLKATLKNSNSDVLGYANLTIVITPAS